MKFFIGLIIVACLAVGAMVMFGGYGEDPKVQAENLKNSVTPGMKWEDVVAVHRPKNVVPIWRHEDGTERDGAKEPFDEAKLKDHIATNYFSGGFKFPYTFTADDVIHVYFDGKGVVSYVDADVRTANDILSGKAVGY